MMENKRIQTILIISACAVLVLAIVWAFTRGSNSELKPITDKINSLGYSFHPDDLFIAYDNSNTTIAEVIAENEETQVNEKELEKIIAESKAYGFDSDIKKRGGVTLILAREGTKVIICYLVDGEIELLFTQNISS
ncbi:MAG: hypothetical protein GX802_01145 [Clostridiales bacterium]|jgi:hypothetical protein|nr:hypothetical protein [Clostridiales bacterium]